MLSLALTAGALTAGQAMADVTYPVVTGPQSQVYVTLGLGIVNAIDAANAGYNVSATLGTTQTTVTGQQTLNAASNGSLTIIPYDVIGLGHFQSGLTFQDGLVNNGSLAVINNYGTLNITGNISGTGSIEVGGNFTSGQYNTGTTILTGVNTFTGGVFSIGAGEYLENGSNTYTNFQSVDLEFATTSSLPSTGPLYTAYDGAIGFGWAFDQSVLNRVQTINSPPSFPVLPNRGIIALGADNSNDLDFNGKTGLGLGATNGVWTYSGKLWTSGETETPITASGPLNGATDYNYKVGGGNGTLIISSALTDEPAILTNGNRTTVNYPTMLWDGFGYTILSGANTYSGGTEVTASGVVQFANPASVGAPGTNYIFVDSQAVVATGYAMDQAFLDHIAASSTGSIGLTQDTSNPLNLSNLSNATLIALPATRNGPTPNITLSGALIPANNAYSFDSGAGTLKVASALTDGPLAGVGAGPNSLTIYTSGGVGSVVLTTNATYSGSTSIDGYRLQLGDQQTTVNLLNTSGVSTVGGLNGGYGGALVFAEATPIAFTSVVSGAGEIEQDGPGTVTLTKPQTYTGQTWIAGGTLALGPGASLPSDNDVILSHGDAAPGLQSALGDNAAVPELDISAAGNQTVRSLSGLGPSFVNLGGNTLTITGFEFTPYGGVIKGSGAIVIGAGDFLTLSGLNTYSGGTTIPAAAALFVGTGPNGTAGSLGTGPIDNEGNLYFDEPTTLTLSNVFTGSGTVSFGNALGSSLSPVGGNIILTGNSSTFTGAILITGAYNIHNFNAVAPITLQLGDGVTNGSLGTGDVAFFNGGGTLAFNEGSAQTIANSISAYGSLAQNGPGSVTLSGANAIYDIIGVGGAAYHTGQVAVNTGAVYVTGSLGASSFTVAPNALLQFGEGGATGTITPGFGNSNDIADNGTLTFDTTASQIYAGVISGSGVVNQNAGMLQMTGASTYTGATTVNGGLLTVDGALGATALTIASSGTLGGVGTIGGPVTVNGGGHLVGVAGQTLTMDSLTLNAGANLDVTLGAPSSLNLFDVGHDLTLAGTVNVTQAAQFGDGVYGLITYGGSLTNNGMTITGLSQGDIGHIQTSVAGQVNLLVSAVATGSVPNPQFWNGSTTTPTGSVAGGSGTWSASSTLTNWTDADGARADAWAGQMAIFQGARGANAEATVTVDDSAGQVATTGLQFIGNGWVVQGGALALAADVGPTSIRVGDGTTAGATDTATIASVLTGSGGLTKTDRSILILTGANAYSGGTAINAGSLQIGNGGTEGSISGAVADNSALVFDHSDNLTFAGVISGAGSVSQIGGGALTLTGANTYAGGTFIDAGAVDIQTNAALGSGAVTLANGGTLIFDAPSLTLTNAVVMAANVDPTITVKAGNQATLSGVISGSAPVTFSGGGTANLTASNSYTGTTTVSGAGTKLLVNGSIATSFLTTVNAGATLGGAGSVGALTIASGATYSPGLGTPGATQTVSGALTFNSGSTFAVAVSPNAANSATVSGAATLGGAKVAVTYTAGAYLTKTYTLLQASGGLGGSTFGSLAANNLPSGFGETLSYDGNAVYLNLTAGLNAGATTGLPDNPQAVSNTINTYFNGGGALPPNFVSLFTLTGAPLTQALANVSGELPTGAQQVAYSATDDFLGALLDPAAPGRGDLGADLCTGGPTTRPCTPRLSVWASATGGYGRLDGDLTGVGSHDLTRNGGGIASGFDYHLTPGGVIGVAAAGSDDDWTLSQGLGKGEGHLFQVGAYGWQQAGQAYVSVAVGYGWQQLSTKRVALGGLLTGHYDTHDWSGRIEAGYRFGVVTPYLAIQTQTFSTPQYAEDDRAGTGFGLTYFKGSFHDTRSEFGARLDQSFALAGAAPIELRLQAAYVNAQVSDPRLKAAFSQLPGSGFTVEGAVPDRSSGLVSVGVQHKVSTGAILFGKVDGEFASQSESYGARLGVRYGW